eukprot:CAMPEP_0117887710 /NCGR_PEP_ID=MMETSP0950-20121206/21332_1 /TAXON_ID=44440 /ORGANISM="Chattonella subsalsa, Strain CCMP2191" /LENGTH=127 /DNA_ID=CAMNT_0005745709 /DNA_START=238 /DNA_END=617 /DNA_ORIENTATION=+
MAEEQQKMDEKIGWPYDRYPNFGWLFRKDLKIHSLYQSLLDEGYCIFKLSDAELESLRLLVEISEKGGKQYLQAKDDEVGIFDHSKNAARYVSRRYTKKWKAGDYGNMQLNNYPMTKMIKCWIRDHV